MDVILGCQCILAGLKVRNPVGDNVCRTIERCEMVVRVSQTPVNLSMASDIVMEATELGQVTSAALSETAKGGYGTEALQGIKIEPWLMIRSWCQCLERKQLSG